MAVMTSSRRKPAQPAQPGKFVVQVNSDRGRTDRPLKRKRWGPTIWTRGPVSMRAAKAALTRAQERFPDAEYRVVPYTGQKPLYLTVHERARACHLSKD